MAYIKSLFFVAAVVAVALAAEEPIREKKAVVYGAGVYAAHDDGQWAPGKYDGVQAYSAYPYAAYPAAHAAYPAVHAAYPAVHAAYPYAAHGYRSVVY